MKAMTYNISISQKIILFSYAFIMKNPAKCPKTLVEKTFLNTIYNHVLNA